MQTTRHRRFLVIRLLLLLSATSIGEFANSPDPEMADALLLLERISYSVILAGKCGDYLGPVRDSSGESLIRRCMPLLLSIYVPLATISMLVVRPTSSPLSSFLATETTTRALEYLTSKKLPRAKKLQGIYPS